MTTIRRVRPKRGRLQRGIIILPSAFTIGNLFLGVYAMVSAARGDFEWASWSIVLAALLDMLDGRIARFTATGSRFGAELDSLVDAISFGVAPAFVIYELFFADQPWSWILSFLYVTAGVIRLARFNVEQGGHAKRSFHGLPSPTAGMILATIYPFFTAPAVAPIMNGLPSTQTVGILMISLAVLMLSHIPYPLVPKLSLRNPRATAGSLFAWQNAFPNRTRSLMKTRKMREGLRCGWWTMERSPQPVILRLKRSPLTSRPPNPN